MIKLIAKQLRIHQWTKNFLIFLPVFLAHVDFDLELVKILILGFIAFSFTASSVYILNDIFDLESDKKHPEKKKRPIASGLIDLNIAYSILLFLLVSGLLLSFSINIKLFFILLFYLLSNFAYTLYFKNFVILDIIFLTLFYTIRVISGHIIGLNEFPSSPWLISFIIFFFFSLGAVKRYSDILLMLKNQSSSSMERGYQLHDRTLIMAIGISSGLISALIVVLYTSSEIVSKMYKNPIFLVALVPFIIYWISRLWILASRGNIKKDPVFFTLRDTISYIVLFLCILIIFISKYY